MSWLQMLLSVNLHVAVGCAIFSEALWAVTDHQSPTVSRWVPITCQISLKLADDLNNVPQLTTTRNISVM